MAKTPMMQQYAEIKEKYEDYILFYRLGDFYELFYKDAEIGSRELDLTLTGRDCGEEERAPMCGMPFHSSDSYIQRLVEKGYKVAVCEQTEDPALAKGLVKRDVVRIITPGTIIESGFLNESKNNYLCAVCIEEASCGVAFIDITAGIINATFFTGPDYLDKLLNETGIFSPSEALINADKSKFPRLSRFLTDKLNAVVSDNQNQRFELETARKTIEERFGGNPELGSSIDVSAAPDILIRSIGALLDYLYETQKSDILNVTEISLYDKSLYMEIDLNTRRNLEISETMRSKEKKGSLLWVIDKTRTSKGARTLKQWLEQPLLNCRAIQKRQRAVGELIEKVIEREKIKRGLSDICDIDRIVTKIVYRTANARDLKKLASSIKNIPGIKEQIRFSVSELISELNANTDGLTDIFNIIDRAITDEPPVSVKDGGFVKSGFNEEVDRLRAIISDNKSWLEKIENSERESTGIKSLKIRYNKVFGYYIEVSKSYINQVPEKYIRRQTLANGERYVTEELKEMESSILSANEKLAAAELDIFEDITKIIAANIHRFQKTSYALSCIDALYSLAEIAEKNNYICPEVDYSDILSIKDGRHPVVEIMQRDNYNYYVPNDVYMDNGRNRLYIITGPNMAGKSTYMRQTAVITLLAQIGSYVPASEARIGLVDKIFTRVGAADDLAAGQSTFMLEMSEVAYILKNATKKSLIVYDEIGRGTSTFDGMSMARAVLEYTAGKKLGAKTLFATHYHELTEIENEIEGVINYNIAAKKKDGDIVFLRKIIKGAADDSYGIEVAKLAGVPAEIIKRAREVLSGLELKEGGGERVLKKQKATEPKDELENISFEDISKTEIYNKLKSININTLSPLEAFNALYELIKLSEK
ncbi:MAG: DNA mismatch repair protein MutS [Oscillospiraceae bacterium]|nr:DNA mismatch repair protein MutS [Oscillospiraceae bacterium]